MSLLVVASFARKSLWQVDPLTKGKAKRAQSTPPPADILFFTFFFLQQPANCLFICLLRFLFQRHISGIYIRYSLALQFFPFMESCFHAVFCLLSNQTKIHVFSKPPNAGPLPSRVYLCEFVIFFWLAAKQKNNRIVRICRWTLIFAMECRRDWLRLVQAYKLQCIARGLLKYKMWIFPIYSAGISPKHLFST